MRVAIISSTFPSVKPGGVPTYVEGRAAYLQRKCEVRIFALGGEAVENIEGVVLGTPENFKKSFLKVWIVLLAKIIIYRPHRIEIHNIPVGLPLFFLGRPAYFFHGPAGMEAKVEGANPFRVMLSHLLESLVVKRARRIFVVSDAFSDLVQNIHPKIFEEDIKKLRKRYPKMLITQQKLLYAKNRPVCINGEGLRFICVRRLVKRTGVLEMVQAFIVAHQNKQFPHDTRLDIVGHGPLQGTIHDLIISSGMSKHISLHGRLTDEQRNTLYFSSDFNIVPTQDLEGFGLVVVEAALLGCPSMVTEVGALSEVIAQLGGYGVVCKPDVLDMARTFASLQRFSTEQRKTLQEIAVKKFSLLI